MAILRLGIILVILSQVWLNLHWQGQYYQDDYNDSSLASRRRQDTTKQTLSSSRTAISSPTKSKSHAEFAYVFLVSGCDPATPLQYRNYLYNILVAARVLRQGGSQADVVVMIQFAKGVGDTVHELPLSDVQWLIANQIQIHYLPPLIRDNFYNAQLEKFQILQMTQYTKVMYLDADVMPLCNLDYLFELETNNAILAWFTEPAQGGLFVLETGHVEEFERVLAKREQHALSLPYPHWDPVLGWGHVLEQEWKGIRQVIRQGNGTWVYPPARHSTNWTFHGDFADQGLLYYWAMFHPANLTTSIIFLDHVEEWQNGKFLWSRPSAEVLKSPCGAMKSWGGDQFGGLFQGKLPHRDFVHFTGDAKPWEAVIAKQYQQFPTLVQDATGFWYHQLGQIFQEFGQLHPNRTLPKLPLTAKKPTLGRYPTHRSMIASIQKKEKKKKERQELAEQ